MNKLIKRFVNLFIVILLLFVIFIIDGAIESNKINKDIENFKNRGQLVYQNDIYTYYKVSKLYDYEDCNNVVDSYDDKFVGDVGDIYLTDRDPLGGFFITDWISKITWIGHGSIVYNSSATEMLEIVGNKSKEENVVKVVDNIWLDIDSPRYVMLRVKDMDNQKRNIIKQESDKLLGCKYNYLFMFGGNKRFYCTDLISKIYKKIDINTNKDYFFTTGSDIISNEETYLIYYREKYTKNNKECYNIYYLSEE